MKRVVAGFLIFSGISFLVFGAYLVWLRHSPKILTFKEIPKVQAQQNEVHPSSITIPAININLPIIPAVTNGRDWETTHLGVSYLSGSPVPGQKGNSVLYGHNWSSLLGKLPTLKTGEIIEITLSNGIRQKFRVEYTAVVDPNQTYIIENTSDTRLTLYTCTGFLDSKRFVVIAKPA